MIKLQDNISRYNSFCDSGESNFYSCSKDSNPLNESIR